MKITINAKNIAIFVGTVLSVSGLASIVKNIIEFGMLLQHMAELYREWVWPVRHFFYAISGFEINQYVFDYYVIGAPFWLRAIPIQKLFYRSIVNELNSFINYEYGFLKMFSEGKMRIKVFYIFMYIFIIIPTVIIYFIVSITIWPYFVYNHAFHTPKTAIEYIRYKEHSTDADKSAPLSDRIREGKRLVRYGFAAYENFKCVVVCFSIIAAISYGLEKL